MGQNKFYPHLIPFPYHVNRVAKLLTEWALPGAKNIPENEPDPEHEG
jgi:hypothetical protein